MHTAWQFITKTRRRKIAALVLSLVATSATTAIAAFIIYSGVSGSAGGQFTATSTTESALRFASTANPTLTPGAASVPFALTLQNADPNAAHTLTSTNYSVSSSEAGCEAYVEITGEYQSKQTDINSTNPAFDIPVPAGTTDTTAFDGTTIRALNGAPSSCIGATFTVTFTGTAS